MGSSPGQHPAGLNGKANGTTLAGLRTRRHLARLEPNLIAAASQFESNQCFNDGLRFRSPLLGSPGFRPVFPLRGPTEQPGKTNDGYKISWPLAMSTQHTVFY